MNLTVVPNNIAQDLPQPPPPLGFFLNNTECKIIQAFGGDPNMTQQSEEFLDRLADAVERVQGDMVQDEYQRLLIKLEEVAV